MYFPTIQKGASFTTILKKTEEEHLAPILQKCALKLRTVRITICVLMAEAKRAWRRITELKNFTILKSTRVSFARPTHTICKTVNMEKCVLLPILKTKSQLISCTKSSLRIQTSICFTSRRYGALGATIMIKNGVFMLIIGRTFVGNRRFLHIKRNFVKTGRSIISSDRILMVVRTNIGVDPATAGKSNNITLSITKLILVNYRTSARNIIVLTITQPRIEGTPSTKISFFCQRTEEVATAKLTLTSASTKNSFWICCSQIKRGQVACIIISRRSSHFSPSLHKLSMAVVLRVFQCLILRLSRNFKRLWRKIVANRLRTFTLRVNMELKTITASASKHNWPSHTLLLPQVVGIKWTNKMDKSNSRLHSSSRPSSTNSSSSHHHQSSHCHSLKTTFRQFHQF